MISGPEFRCREDVRSTSSPSCDVDEKERRGHGRSVRWIPWLAAISFVNELNVPWDELGQVSLDDMRAFIQPPGRLFVACWSGFESAKEPFCFRLTIVG